VAAAAGAGWRVERANRLRGGIAMAVDAVTLGGPEGASTRLVLKRWLRPGWADDDPAATPAREASVLGGLAGTGAPVPRLVAVDPDGSSAGVPALLMTHVDGRRPSSAQEASSTRIVAMAGALAQIHALGGDVLSRVDAFEPYYEHHRLRVPAQSDRPSLWRSALSLTSQEAPAVAPCFLHRDYHPGNTIWLGGRLSGIVDWVGAAVGPPAVDLAHWRANLGTRHGILVADRVLAAYAAQTGAVPTDQAWWDVRMLLDFLDEPDELRGAELGQCEAYLEPLLARV
jgi:aminoglycoside phosphotransferase (APT) family kinase protein